MKIVHQLDPVRWRAFVDAHPHGNIFHTPEMFEVFTRAKGHQPELWAAIEDNPAEPGAPKILALAPLVKLTLFNQLFRPLTTRAIAYGGVLCAPNAEGYTALNTLLTAYQATAGWGALFTEFRNLADMSDLRPSLAKHGFVYEDHLNFLVDLMQPQDVIWRNISKSTQQRIRTSRNKGTSIEEVMEPERLKIAYRFLQDVYARVQVPLADLSLFRAALDVLTPRGMMQVLLARAGERYAATAFLLSYHGRVLYWYVGADRSLSAYGPSELLVWHAFQWGKEHGFQMFDFGGGGKPDEKYGPREFKSKFGGLQVNFGRDLYVHSPLRLRVSEAVYQFYRRTNFFKASAARV